MRISGIDVTLVTIPFTRGEKWAWGTRKGMTSAIVELHTDEGISGLGEAIVVLGPTPEVVLTVLRSMEGLIRDEDPARIEYLNAKVMVEGAWHGFRPTAHAAWAGIEMACWDVLGKARRVPLVDLLGGRVRTEIKAMFYVYGSDDLEEMLDYAAEGVARGFETIYVKVGIDEERDVELVARLRERIGPRPRLRIDANEAWSPGTAVRILRRMARHVLEFVEQPTLMYDLAGLAHVRRVSGVAVAANQASWGLHRIMDLIRHEACDVIMTDPHQEGGVWAFKKAAALAEAAGLPIVNHAFSPATITMQAQLAVACSSPNFILAGQGHQDLLAGDVVTTPVRYDRGVMRLAPGPGLGLELDREQLDRFADGYRQNGFASAHANQTPEQTTTVPNQ